MGGMAMMDAGEGWIADAAAPIQTDGSVVFSEYHLLPSLCSKDHGHERG